MWICNRCQVSNEEGYTRCIQCGASRTARRFGAGTPVSAPSVTDAAQSGRAVSPPAELPPPPQHRPEAVPIRSRVPVMDDGGRRVVRCAMGRLLVAFGLVLALLLPLSAIALAVIHLAVVQPALLGVILPPGTVSPPFLSTVIYILIVLLSAMILALPGLLAAGLGRLLIRLTPPERKRPPA